MCLLTFRHFDPVSLEVLRCYVAGVVAVLVIVLHFVDQLGVVVYVITGVGTVLFVFFLI